MHFSIIQNNIPESCKDIKIVVYRLESDMNPKEPAKATNLNHQLEIARTVIARKLFVSQNIFKVPMQVKIELPMDIAIPLFKPSEVTLGVVHLMSSSLADKRKKMKNAIKVSPYSEMLYSFSTTTGQAFSVEQLYALPYSVQLSQALLSLWFQERYDFMEESLRTLRQQLDLLNQDNAAITQALTTDTISSGSSEVVATIRDDSTFLQAIDVLDEIFNDCIDCAAHALDTCKKATTGQGIINNVIDIEHGGNVLRRSTWKKITAWQYCTTNLNLHIMVNKLYSFADILENKEANDSSRTLHCIPTITLGVPAAHELKFSEGGLRKIFSDISTHDNKLRWLQAIQAPDLQMLKILFVTHSKEAASLFGSSYMLTNKEELAKVLKRKYELARRIDICSSQALGCAVSVVKSIIMLATIVGGNCKDVLARSLKIGFLVLFQSMLSTNGDELGMIEDLDIAALWLSLVSIRLVRKTDMKGEAVAPTGILKRPTNLEGLESPCTKKRKTAIDVILSSKCYSEDGVPVYKGVGEGVSCQRDEVSILIYSLTVHLCSY